MLLGLSQQITGDVFDVFEFVLIGVLGFMPLIVIHWANRRPYFSMPRLRVVGKRSKIVKAILLATLVNLTDWTLHIQF